MPMAQRKKALSRHLLPSMPRAISDAVFAKLHSGPITQYGQLADAALGRASMMRKDGA